MPQKNRTLKGVLGGLLGLVGLSAVAGVLATAAVTPAIAIDASHLPGEPHSDPVDQLVIATARHLGATDTELRAAHPA